MAIAMNSYLTSGTYDGFDIVKQSIDYCQKAITPVRPSFRFKHVDIYNSEYNAQGTIRPADFRFPYRDGAFTFGVPDLGLHAHAAPRARDIPG